MSSTKLANHNNKYDSSICNTNFNSTVKWRRDNELKCLIKQENVTNSVCGLVKFKSFSSFRIQMYLLIAPPGSLSE